MRSRMYLIAMGASYATVAVAIAAVGYHVFFERSGNRILITGSVIFLSGLLLGAILFRIAGLPWHRIFGLRPPWVGWGDRPYAFTLDSARQLAKSGKTIQAMQVVRDVTGVSLSEARDVVRQMKRGDG